MLFRSADLQVGRRQIARPSRDVGGLIELAGHPERLIEVGERLLRTVLEKIDKPHFAEAPHFERRRAELMLYVERLFANLDGAVEVADAVEADGAVPQGDGLQQGIVQLASQLSRAAEHLTGGVKRFAAAKNFGEVDERARPEVEIVLDRKSVV